MKLTTGDLEARKGKPDLNRDGEVDNFSEIGKEIKGGKSQEEVKESEKKGDSSFPRLYTESILPASEPHTTHLVSVMNMLSIFYLTFFIMYLHVLSFFPILQDFAITVVFFNCTITLRENWTKVSSCGLQTHALHLNNLTIAKQESHMRQFYSICDHSLCHPLLS